MSTLGANCIVCNIEEGYGELWVGSAPPLKDMSELFDVIVLCAKEYQPAKASSLMKVEVVYCPLDDKFAGIPKGQRNLAMMTSSIVAEDVQQGKRVLVTCHLGLNRSSLVASLAVLLLAPGVPSGQVVGRVRSVRGPEALSNPSFVMMIDQASKALADLSVA